MSKEKIKKQLFKKIYVYTNILPLPFSWK